MENLEIFGQKRKGVHIADVIYSFIKGRAEKVKRYRRCLVGGRCRIGSKGKHQFGYTLLNQLITDMMR